jgi:transcription antitermination factor NusG
MHVDTHKINNSVVGSFPSSDLSLNWYVVYTKPLTEKKVAERITQLGFENYLPLYTTIKQWSDRKKKLEKPLINSVVFVRCQLNELQRLYTVPSVAGVLRQDGKPAVVKTNEIQNLRILLQEVVATDLEPISLEPGTPIEVTRGPFKGIIGTAVQVLNTLRVIIEIRQLGIAFSVNVPKSFVKPL